MFKVMIVDDELLMRIGIRSMLEWEAYGFQIIGEGSNGREALQLAARETPDFIITDIKMPVMGGLELIKEASKLLPNCQYAILSQFDEFVFVKEALKLGVSDYLIKSQITQASLVELLTVIRQKLLSIDGVADTRLPLLHDYKESLNHLKESFFKNLISGLLTEEEAKLKAEQLNIRLLAKELIVIKFRLDRFEELKRKYVEKDERLLRFSIINILEEVIPSNWSRELFVENSAEYLVIKYRSHSDWAMERMELLKVSNRISALMKDFMNMTLTIGISTALPNIRSIQKAYREADQALQYRFYTGVEKVLFYEDVAERLSGLSLIPVVLTELDFEIQNVLESKNNTRLIPFLSDLRARLEKDKAAEKDIREVYIFLIEKVNQIFANSGKNRLSQGSQSTYEAVYKAETWEDIHSLLLDYVQQCWEKDSLQLGYRTYAEMAAELIHQYYAEDISLHSVANQINVNPSYLSRVFKQEKEQNFISYLTQVRIEKAKLLLESKRFKVYEVADQVGYHNYTYFSKIFKKIVGVSPEEYRSQKTDHNLG